MRSIRVRLIVAMLSLIVMLTVVLSVTFIQQTASSVVASQLTSANRLASLASDRIGAHVARRDIHAILDGMTALTTFEDVTGAVVTGSDGDVLAEVGQPTANPASHAVPDLMGFRTLVPLIQRIFEGHAFTATAPIYNNELRIGTLSVFINSMAIRDEVLRIAGLAVAIAILVGIIATLAAMALQTMITRPLHNVALAMDIAGRTGRYDETIPEDGPNETAVIARTFNAMITRIGARDQILQEQKAELESKVSRRTRDLEVAKDSAESANVAKSVFLATMSHEIRTPLNGMLVMAELLAKSDLDPKRKRYAQLIESSGRSLVNIINDVLDLSKIEAGALSIDPIAVQPRKIIADVIDIFAEKAATKDLDIAGYADPTVPEYIMADPVRLKQILSNFVNNGIKFTAKGYIYVEMNHVDGRLQISVRDTGIGIKPENQDRIFEPFSQEESSTVRRYGGTGLGLSICRKLVEAMDGRIGFESEPGKGSVFFVDLACVPANGGDAVANEAAEELRARRIGFLPSDALGMRVMAQTLADIGVEVAEVSGTEPNIETLQALDLIIGSPSDVTSFIEVLPPDDAYSLRDKLVCAAAPSDSKRDWLRDSGHVTHTLDLPASRDGLADELFAIFHADAGDHEPIKGTAPEGPSFPEIQALVADDNAVNREVMAAILDQFDIQSIFVCNGTEAVEACCSNRFDIVFMDINMPVMDGVEAVKRIRDFEGDSGMPRAPIVALTAHGEKLDDRPWQDLGFDAYVGKPVRVADIQSALLALDITTSFTQSGGETSDAGNPDTQSSRMLIDWSTIDDLTRTLDESQRKNLYDTVLGIYCTDTPNQLKALFDAIDAGDVEQVHATAHAVKSVSLNVGAVRVARLAADIEAAAREGRIEASDETRQALTDLLDQTISIFSERTKSAA